MHRYVFMYACIGMYLCMHAYMHVCVYACMYASMSVCTYVYVYVSLYACLYVCTFTDPPPLLQIRYVLRCTEVWHELSVKTEREPDPRLLDFVCVKARLFWHTVQVSLVTSKGFLQHANTSLFVKCSALVLYYFVFSVCDISHVTCANLSFMRQLPYISIPEGT